MKASGLGPTCREGREGDGGERRGLDSVAVMATRQAQIGEEGGEVTAVGSMASGHRKAGEGSRAHQGWSRQRR